MKTFRLFAGSLLVAAFFAVAAFAQTNTQAAGANASTRIAVINTSAFGEAAAGIAKYKSAMTTLENEFKPGDNELRTMAGKYQAMQEEIKKLQNPPANVPVNRSTLQTKIEEYGKLERDIKFKQEDLKARYQSRLNTLLGPIMQDISTAIQAYAKQKGYALIFDAGKLDESGLILGLGDEKIDVTKDFITFYNARPSGTATTATPK